MDRSIRKEEFPQYASEVIENIKVEIEATEVEEEALDAGCMETGDNLYDMSAVVCKEEVSENCLASEGLNEGIVTPLLINGTCKIRTAETQNNEDFSKCLQYTSFNNMGCLNIFANVKAPPANSTPPLEYFIEISPIAHDNQGIVNRTKHKSNISRNTKTIDKHKKFNRKNENNTIEDKTDSKSHIQSLDIKPLNAIIKNNIQPSQSRSLLRNDVFASTHLIKDATIDNRSTFLQYKTVKHNSNPESGKSSAGKQFACKFCSYKCRIRSSIVRHMRTHTSEKQFSCDLCDFKCTIMRALVRHKRTHAGDKPFSCEICDYKCSRRVSLALHTRTHTGIKLFSCEICDYKGIRKEYLDRHMKVHVVGKIYLCDHCKFKSSKRSSFVQHMGTHNTEKPYSCDICSYKSRRKCLLIKHKRVHTGEKPYSCNICNYSCGLKSALVRHKRTHTGEKPYACKVCDYKSSRNEHLVRHMKIHPAGKLLSCDLCSFTCGLQKSLRCHMKSHL